MNTLECGYLGKSVRFSVAEYKVNSGNVNKIQEKMHGNQTSTVEKMICWRQICGIIGHD